MTATNRSDGTAVAPEPDDGTAVAPAQIDLELRLTRLIDAPRALVFRAWTDPEMLVTWMAPRGMSAVPLALSSPVVGGSFRVAFRDDDGVREEFIQLGTYRDVVPLERLVYTFAWEGDDGLPEHESTITVTFSDRDGKTELTLHQAFLASKASRDRHVVGWTSVLDRLVEVVEGSSTVPSS